MTGKDRLALVAAMAAGVPAPAMAAETITYGYDARGRLIQVARTGTVNDGVATAYTFDKADNRTAKAVTGVPGNGYRIIPTGPAGGAPGVVVVPANAPSG